MFDKWKQKRALKKLQGNCFHEYHIVSSYKMDVGGAWDVNYKVFHDMYCPICDRKIYEITDINAKRQLEEQRVRREYKETM